MRYNSKTVLFLILFLNAIRSEGQRDSLSGWQLLKVENSSIYYPKELIVDTSGRMGTIFILKTPLEDSLDQFLENFNLIGIYGIFNDFSIKEWGEENVKNLPKTLNNVKVIWEGTTTVSKETIYKVIYDSQMGDFDLRVLQYYYKRKESFYVLTFTSERKLYERYEEFALKLMSTFSILPG